MSADLRHVLGLAAAGAIVLLFVALLGVLFRFSFRGRDASRRKNSTLRSPDVAGVSQLCGFNVPESLVDFYRSGRLIEEVEFELADESVAPPHVWEVAGFLSLAKSEVEDWLKVSGVPGIPIATDFGKGIYYVNQTGAVLLRAPCRNPDPVVARSIEALAAYTLRRASDSGDSA